MKTKSTFPTYRGTCVGGESAGGESAGRGAWRATGVPARLGAVMRSEGGSKLDALQTLREVWPGLGRAGCIALILLAALPGGLAATNDITAALQKGLFEEEANQNLGAAIQAYESVASQFDKDRKLAATAIFRLGECYRKQGNTNEAASQYERILREFSDQPALVTLSRQNLAGLGSPAATPAVPAMSSAARQEQGRLLEEEIKLVELKLATQQRQFEAGVVGQDALWATQRDLLNLRRQLVALDASQPVVTAAAEGPAGAPTSTEAEEVKRIQALIKDSPDLINAKGAESRTPLHLAAEKGQMVVAQFLLDNGAEVEAKDRFGFTPLHLATRSGHKGMVELLLGHKADVEAADKDGNRPLHMAAERGYRSVLEILLAHKGDINGKNRYGWTPLHVAAANGYKSIAEALLGSGAEVNVASENRQTPLHVAAERGDQAIVELLLAGKANVNAADKDGQTPLHLAASRGHVGVATLLLAHGAEVNAKGTGEQNRGWTPLHSAVAAKQKDMVALLLKSGADPNLRMDTSFTVGNQTYTGCGPLFMAALACDSDIVESLLAAKADPNLKSASGRAPLLNAVSCKPPDRKRIVAALLEHGADPDTSEQDGRPPIISAIYSQDKDVVELLLAHKAGVNAKDRSGWSPLHCAAQAASRGYNTIAIAELLLAAGAEANARDNSGNTPLKVAGSGPYSPRNPGTTAAEMAELLRQHGAVEQMPDFATIRLTRKGLDQPPVIFRKDTNALNHFTLLEVIGNYYAYPPAYDAHGAPVAFTPSYRGGGALPFPDFSKISIHRPLSEKPGEEKVIQVVLARGTNSIDCGADVRLEFGDVVEIPEREHSLAAARIGLTDTQTKELDKFLARKITVVVKGERTEITLSGKSDTWLSQVLKSGTAQSILRSSSDLSRVRVTRREGGGAKAGGITEDVRRFWQDQARSWDDVWLRDGDVVEVPEGQPGMAVPAPSTPTPPYGIPTTPAPPKLPTRAPAVNLPTQPAPLSQPSTLAPPSPPGVGFQQRLQSILRRESEPNSQAEQESVPSRVIRLPSGAAPSLIEERRLNLRGVLYSPTPEDAELLKGGYHLDRSVKTRKAEVWEERAPADRLKGRAGNTAVWTGKEMIVFGGEALGTSFDDGARYDVARDSWELLPRKGAPSSRTGQAAVWTGQAMIIWGGFGGTWGEDVNHNDGARYSPASDAWKAVSTGGAPAARFDVPAVWTGKEMLVWGGFTDSHSRYQGGHADAHLNTGGRYNPETDSWKPIAARGAPTKRCWHALVWTGKEMIVWGGGNATKALNDGGRYNPARDTWRTMSTDGAPGARVHPVAVWTGKEMIVWGGASREADAGAVYFENGARYNPETDTWRPMSTVGAPKGRILTLGVWTGTEMLVWGGVNDAQAGGVEDASRYMGTGARYDPANDTWTEMTNVGAPTPRLTSGVWTGEGLLIFGGYNGLHLNDTWFYSPLRTLYPYVKEG